MQDDRPGRRNRVLPPGSTGPAVCHAKPSRPMVAPDLTEAVSPGTQPAWEGPQLHMDFENWKGILTKKVLYEDKYSTSLLEVFKNLTNKQNQDLKQRKKIQGILGKQM